MLCARPCIEYGRPKAAAPYSYDIATTSNAEVEVRQVAEEERLDVKEECRPFWRLTRGTPMFC